MSISISISWASSLLGSNISRRSGSSSSRRSLSAFSRYRGAGANVALLNKLIPYKINNNNYYYHSLATCGSTGFKANGSCLQPESDELLVGGFGAEELKTRPTHTHNHNHRDYSEQQLLHVVLVSPQIPGNTGCIARTCAASGVKLHLVEPLGFQVDDTKLKRAGLDYWPYVVVKVHPSWADFRDYFLVQDGKNRLLAFTKRGTAIHSDFAYRPGDWLVFGSETSGLPPEALEDCRSETYGGGAIKIPMVDTYVRCLNLSVSVGIAVYEASRQLNYQQLQYLPETTCTNGETPFIVEDIFA